MPSRDVVICAAVRTAIGTYNGSLKDTPAVELGAIAIRACLERSGIDGGEVGTVVMGNVIQAGNKMNPARQAALVRLPSPARRTITFDRGSEFLGYQHLARNYGIAAYFCDPHSPWQKGSVENTNGRLRRYLPGELDLASITPAYLEEIESRMNSTPRKCLGFRTPHEAFAAMAH